MPRRVKTARVKVVTLIATVELRDRLQKDLEKLGAPGYTTASVDGRGRHGPRLRGLLDLANVRIEAVVLEPLARKILEHIDREYRDFEVLAFVYDAEGVPTDHFG